LVFLDINMPDGEGFNVLEQVSHRDFEVIFTTAFDTYAIRAFEFSALHYLLKPVDESDLQSAVARFESRREHHLDDKIKVFNNNNQSVHKKILLPSSEALNVVDIDDIIRCESSSNYTTFYMKNNEHIMVSKSIGNYASLLSEFFFVRIHNKHLINLKYVKSYVKGRGGFVIMQDSSEVEISEGKRREFMDKLSQYALI